MSAGKGIPLTKKEALYFLQLVEAHPILFNKTTNAKSNKVKETIWIRITEQFNAKIKSGPRKPNQLRLKWENLKKSCRKRIAQLSNIDHMDGDHYIPPNEVLDRVAAILDHTNDSYSYSSDDTAEAEKIETVEEFVNVSEPETSIPTTTVLPRVARTQKTKFYGPMTSKEKQKRQAIFNAVKLSLRDKNRAIAEYYISKRKREEAIHEYKIKIMEIEIKEREQKLLSNANKQN